jgi:hypothetical protein
MKHLGFMKHINALVSYKLKRPSIQYKPWIDELFLCSSEFSLQSNTSIMILVIISSHLPTWILHLYVPTLLLQK